MSSAGVVLDNSTLFDNFCTFFKTHSSADFTTQKVRRGSSPAFERGLPRQCAGAVATAGSSSTARRTRRSPGWQRCYPSLRLRVVPQLGAVQYGFVVVAYGCGGFDIAPDGGIPLGVHPPNRSNQNPQEGP
jgi:hypothetical protein